MKTVLEDMSSGHVQCFDIPQPELRLGGILVQVHHSAISAGTERAKLKTGEQSLVKKALARPDLVRQVLDFASDKGIRAAYQKVQSRLQSLSPLGYSCSGVVLEVSPEVHEFRPGDRVACAGAGYANHSEVNFIPRNLAVPVPSSVDLAHASLTTIGAIAMQGLRQADVSFGESIAVIGAGLVGVLTVMLARAAGLRVVALDRNPERVARAQDFGAHLALTVDDPDLHSRVREFSRTGVDAALITAATPSSDPLDLASHLARDRARLVVVGDVGMDVPRRELYHKELSVVLSRSYGPGRYDPSYEEAGNDYPIGYVRWTEQRNMQAFLDYAASGAINLANLVQQRSPVERAQDAYAQVTTSGAYTVVLDYPAARGTESTVSAPVARFAAPAADKLNVGCIGPGGFASGTLIPILRDLPHVQLTSVSSASGTTARNAQRQFGFSSCTTTKELLGDDRLNLVLISSRHNSHAPLVVQALSHRKAVFVEKPLATTPEQLDDVIAAYESERLQEKEPFVMVGFNRRFAPFTESVREFFSKRTEPMAINVRINAGYLPPSHWTQQSEGGGRIVGEFCHFIDWVRSVVGHPFQTFNAAALPNKGKYQQDNVALLLTFADGSTATLNYLANGHKSVPKEHFEIFCEGAVARLDDFKRLDLVRAGRTKTLKARQDKGHGRELALTVEALRSDKPCPIPFSEIVEVTRLTFAIEKAIATGQAVPLQAEVAVAI